MDGNERRKIVVIFGAFAFHSLLCLIVGCRGGEKSNASCDIYFLMPSHFIASSVVDVQCLPILHKKQKKKVFFVFLWLLLGRHCTITNNKEHNQQQSHTFSSSIYFFLLFIAHLTKRRTLEPRNERKKIYGRKRLFIQCRVTEKIMCGKCE